MIFGRVFGKPPLLIKRQRLRKQWEQVTLTETSLKGMAAIAIKPSIKSLKGTKPTALATLDTGTKASQSATGDREEKALLLFFSRPYGFGCVLAACRLHVHFHLYSSTDKNS
jgi:hypothetical protein